MAKSLEELALEVEGPVSSMIKELGMEKYKQVYNYLLEKVRFPKHLDAKENIALALPEILKGSKGAIIFYKELANELAKPEGERNENTIKIRMAYFKDMIREFLDSYFDAQARGEGR